MLSRLKLYASQIHWARRYTERYAADHWMWYQRMRTTLKPYLPEVRGIRAMDIGCGLLQWQTILLHSEGARVTGVDTEYVRGDRRPDKYWKIWRTNGIERAIKTAVWDYTFRNRYQQALRRLSSFPLKRKQLDLRQHTAERLPFAADTFDLLVSHEVFEHIQDVPAAVLELRRVLRPGGLAYVNIHLFPSISGGHHMEWKFPDFEPSSKVPAWDHLRKRQFPHHPSWLNEMRERDYRPIFEQAMEILVWEASTFEGETQLTPEIANELSDYPRDELLKKGLIIVARKP